MYLCNVDLIEMGLFDNVHILGLIDLIAIYGHVCQQYSIKQIFVQTLICKVILGLFDEYLEDCFNGNRRSLKISKFGKILGDSSIFGQFGLKHPNSCTHSIFKNRKNRL